MLQVIGARKQSVSWSSSCLDAFPREVTAATSFAVQSARVVWRTAVRTQHRMRKFGSLVLITTVLYSCIK